MGNKIIEHDHADYLEDRVLTFLLLEQLISFPIDESLRELVMLCKKIATVLSYSVYRHRSELPAPNIMDVEPYFNTFIKFLSDTTEAMNDLRPLVMTAEPEPEPEPPVEDVFCPII